MSAISLVSISSRINLWKHEDTDFVSLVSHDNVWFVRVLLGVQYLRLQGLSMKELILHNNLMLNGSISETLCQCLHDPLLERVVPGQVLLVANTHVELKPVQPSEQPLVSDLKVLGSLNFQGIMDVKHLHVLFVSELVVKSFEVKSVQVLDQGL